MSELFSQRITGWVILLFGRPGSGKDTQGEVLRNLLIKSLGLDEQKVSYFITSLHLDWRSQASDVLAGRIKHFRSLRDSGVLLPPQLVCEVVEEYFDCLLEDTTVILNGFPRSYEQGKDLAKIIGHKKMVAILLDLPRGEAVDRLHHRNQGRVDDTPEKITIRQNVFEADLPGIMQSLQENRVPILEVGASGPSEEVSARIESDLRRFFTTPAEFHSQPQVFIPGSVAM